MSGRAATPDGLLIACSTLGIAAIVGGLLVDPHKRSQLAKSIVIPRLGWWPMMIGYASLGGALLAKGPVGLILPMLVVHVWWLMVQRPSVDSLQLPPQRWKRAALRVWNIFQPRQLIEAILSLRTVPGVCLAIAIAAPWYIAVGVATDGEFIAEFLWRHNVSRAVSSMEGHDGGILFYPIALLVGTFSVVVVVNTDRVVGRSRQTSRRCGSHFGDAGRGLDHGDRRCLYLRQYETAQLYHVVLSRCGLIVGGFMKDFAASVRMPSRGWRTLAGAVAVTVAFCMATD